MYKFLGDEYIKIFEQLYSGSDVIALIKRYDTIINAIMSGNFFSALVATLKALALGIVLFYCLLDLANKATEKNFSTAQLFKVLLRYYVAGIIILNTDVIVQNLFKLSTGLASSVSSASGSMDFGKQINLLDAKTKQTFYEKLDAELGFLDTMGYVFKGAIPWFICIVSELIIHFVLITRALELSVRMIFAPLAMTGIYKGGTQSAGVRYIKKILSLALQVVVIVLICAVAQTIITYIGSTSGAGSNAISSGQSLMDILFNASAKDATLHGTITGDSAKAFLDATLGGAKGNYWMAIGVMLAKLGILYNSMPFCDELIGAR